MRKSRWAFGPTGHVRGVVGRYKLAASVATLCLLACAMWATAGVAAPASHHSKAGLPAVNALLAKYTGVPVFKAPGPSLNVASLKGDRVFILPLNDNTYNIDLDNAIQAAAKAVGMKSTVYATQGKLSQFVQGINLAIAQKYKVLILSGPDPASLGPQIAAAKKAGVAVISTHWFDNGSAPAPKCKGCSAGVAGIETAPFGASSQLMAAWAIAHSGGKNVDALAVYVAGIPPSPPGIAAVKQEFANSGCVGCKVTFVSVPLADFASNALANDISSAIAKDPNINWVIDQVDAMTPATFTALSTAGRSTVQVVAYNGDPFALNFIRQKTKLVMDVGESVGWIGYASVDVALRVLLKQPVVAENTPMRLWSSANITQAGVPAQQTAGYGSSYVKGYLSLWKH